jgi:metal-responsive CopG/Arc/MetJ family transcriptional regulator
MKTITIRIDEEIFQQIEARRGEASKSDFYRNILIEYISDKPENAPNKPEDDLESSEYVLNIRKENETLRTDASHKDAILVLKDDRIKDLQNQLGFLQFEYQKLSNQLYKLLPEPKKWWMFWKK